MGVSKVVSKLKVPRAVCAPSNSVVAILKGNAMVKAMPVH